MESWFRYDFQQDHDTGEDDHSDAIVRRYSDITLTHAYGIPGSYGHGQKIQEFFTSQMQEPIGFLWVNTDDSTYQTEDIH